MRLDRAGWPFVGGALAVTLGGALVSPVVAAVGVLVLIFVVNFFRDPERTTASSTTAIIAPADGRVIRADGRVSIFMNVFDVHVCRAPSAGTVTSVDHTPGRFLAAMRDDASEHNERVTLVVAGPGGQAVSFSLVAGLIARRIICRVDAGHAVAAGERVGIIRFGSRVDVDLPDGAETAVRLGDRVVAGETVIAHRRATEPSPI